MARVSVLAVRPHPDDECTGTGGITAYYADRGVPVGVLTCTLGEEGEIHDPDLDPDEARPRLADIRHRELERSCRVLGVSELRLLGYRDSGMEGTDANHHPDAFWNAPLDEAGGRVAAVIRELRPQVVITENERGTYGHPDHVKCHTAAVRGVELAADPAFATDGLEPWNVQRLFAIELVTDGGQRIADMLRAENLEMGWFENTEALTSMRIIKVDDADAAVDVADYAHVIRDALSEHRTQIPRDNFLLTWPEHILREVFRTAYFTQLRLGQQARGNGRQQATGNRQQPLKDLFEGLPS
jgi:N-acetyl-1-D-myo-inositol-2-amino-2-deoxy-alpha-D-glucopyranoside deacetylase